ncbi:MAG: arginine repressor [Vagococcus sp.]
MNKKERQEIIKRIISENEIKNQYQLIEHLEEEGVFSTQATISRDIQELNIVKSRNNEGIFCYRVLHNTIVGTKKLTDEERLIHTLSETGVSLTQIEYNNILNVHPGNGQVVGILIDSIRTYFTEIVGCIAGDDTILIMSRNKEDATKVYNYFIQYLYPE